MAPGSEYRGKEVHPTNGKSMLGLMRGEADHVHGPGEAVVYEMAGSAAVFRDGCKLQRNNPPFGDRRWRLYRPNEDPVESNDLAASQPKVLAGLVGALGFAALGDLRLPFGVCGSFRADWAVRDPSGFVAPRAD